MRRITSPRLLASSVTVALVCVMGACGVRGQVDPATDAAVTPSVRCAPPDDPAVGVVPVTVWSTLPDEAEAALEQLLELQYQRDHPEIQLTVEHMLGYEARRRMIDGDRPDVVITSLEALVNFADGGVMTPVQDCIDHDPSFDADDFVPISAATYRLDGEQVALPLAVSTPVLYYDRDRFEEAGLDPDAPPTTWEEVAADVAAMRAVGVASTGMTYGDPAWFITQAAAQAGVPLIAGDNGRTDRLEHRGAIDLGDPSVTALLERLQGLAEDGTIRGQQSDEYTGNQDLYRLLFAASERSPMTLHTSGSMDFAYDAFPGGPDKGDLGIGPMPGDGVGALVGGTGIWLTTDNQAAAWPAWSIIRYLTDAPQQAELSAFGYAPVRKSTLAEPALQALWAARPGLSVPYAQLIDVPVEAARMAAVTGTIEHVVFRLNWLADDVMRGRDIADAVAAAQTDIDTFKATYDEMRYGNP